MFAKQQNDRHKLVSESAIMYKRIDLFSHNADPNGIFFGDQILQIVGAIAKEVAERHAETICKKIAIDFVRFSSSAKRGDILSCSIAVNRTWESVLEVGVKVIAEDFRMLEKKNILKAYFVFHAVNQEKNLVDIAAIRPVSSIEKKRFVAAEKRRELRNRNILSSNS